VSREDKLYIGTCVASLLLVAIMVARPDLAPRIAVAGVGVTLLVWSVGVMVVIWKK
jgi:hypothetical protein